MDNHVHLVVDPGTDASSISTMMKRLAGRHSRRLNRRHNWSGSIWESRFKCSPIDSDGYLLICGIYVDLNPVRAGIVSTPAKFMWSSYRSRAGLTTCEWLDADPALEALARTAERRWARYRELVEAPLREDQLKLIRESLHRNQLTGGAAFAEKMSRDTGVIVSQLPPGRPRKAGSPTAK
jgi:putative transposase